MAIFLFFVIIIILVTVHELGHFIAAKRAGIRVEEFGIGFPPRAKTLFKKGGTIYSLNWLPFGGFVKIYGENPEDVTDGDKKDALVSKPKLIQAWVLFAGVFFNMLLAWVLLTATFIHGVPASVADYPEATDQALVVLDVSPKSPAADAGLKPSDVITEIQENGKVFTENLTAEILKTAVVEAGTTPVQLSILRKGESSTVTLIPRPIENGGEALIGISMDRVGTIKYGFFQAIGQGAVKTVVSLKDTAIALGGLLRDAILGQADLTSVSGPVGLVGVVGTAYDFGLSDILYLAALISINLAIINLIPFPALDGGRLLFLLIESIKGSPIKPKIANILNTIGFFALIALMLVVTYHDIAKIVAR